MFIRLPDHPTDDREPVLILDTVTRFIYIIDDDYSVMRFDAFGHLTHVIHNYGRRRLHFTVWIRRFKHNKRTRRQCSIEMSHALFWSRRPLRCNMCTVTDFLRDSFFKRLSALFRKKGLIKPLIAIIADYTLNLVYQVPSYYSFYNKPRVPSWISYTNIAEKSV